MRTKNTQAYALANVPAPDSHVTPVFVLDPKGALIADTNRARLEAKLEVLQSLSPDFADVSVVQVTIRQISA